MKQGNYVSTLLVMAVYRLYSAVAGVAAGHWSEKEDVITVAVCCKH